MPFANSETRNAQRAKWSPARRAKANAYYREWRERNVEKCRTAAKKSYELNKEERKAYGRAQYANNPERAKANASAYRKRNLEKCRSWDAKRRVLKKNGTVGDPRLIEAWERDWRKKRRVSCFWCRESFPPKDCHADHITAISIGGQHAIGNLCISCARCNSTKKAKTVAEWNEFIAEPVLL